MSPVDRSRLPAIRSDPAFRFPAIVKRVLPSGLGVWTVEHRELPVVTFLLVLPVGSGSDPDARPGLVAMTADLLDEGSGRRSAIDVHDALARIGAQFDTEVGADVTVLVLTTLARFAARGAGLLADMVVRPRLDPADVDRVRELRATRLVQLKDVPAAVAEWTFLRALYGSHPYGHIALGTEASVRSTTADEIRALHARAFDPRRATIFAVGDGTHEDLAAVVADAFGSWGSDAAPFDADGALARPDPPGDRLTLVDRPGAAHAELRLGHLAPPRRTDDYHALLVLNMALGGQFVSRINMNLRERKGYTYGVRTAFEFKRGYGAFLLQTSVQTDAAATAIREAVDEMAAIRAARPVTAEELDLARAALTRGYPRNFETAEQIARAMVQLALYGLPDDYFDQFAPRILAVDADAVLRVARAHLDPDGLVTVVVADQRQIGESLATVGEVTLR